MITSNGVRKSSSHYKAYFSKLMFNFLLYKTNREHFAVVYSVIESFSKLLGQTTLKLIIQGKVTLPRFHLNVVSRCPSHF